MWRSCVFTLVLSSVKAKASSGKPNALGTKWLRKPLTRAIATTAFLGNAMATTASNPFQAYEDPQHESCKIVTENSACFADYPKYYKTCLEAHADKVNLALQDAVKNFVGFDVSALTAAEEKHGHLEKEKNFLGALISFLEKRFGPKFALDKDLQNDLLDPVANALHSPASAEERERLVSKLESLSADLKEKALRYQKGECSTRDCPLDERVNADQWTENMVAKFGEEFDSEWGNLLLASREWVQGNNSWKEEQQIQHARRAVVQCFPVDYVKSTACGVDRPGRNPNTDVPLFFAAQYLEKKTTSDRWEERPMKCDNRVDIASIDKNPNLFSRLTVEQQHSYRFYRAYRAGGEVLCGEKYAQDQQQKWDRKTMAAGIPQLVITGRHNLFGPLGSWFSRDVPWGVDLDLMQKCHAACGADEDKCDAVTKTAHCQHYLECKQKMESYFRDLIKQYPDIRPSW